MLVSGGLHGKTQRIDLLSLSVSYYTFRQAHPALQLLQLNLAGFIIQHLSEYLDPDVHDYVGLLCLSDILTALYGFLQL